MTNTINLTTTTTTTLPSRRGHYEAPPYSSDSIRSVYHVRELEVFKLAQLREKPLEVMISHDWPRGVYHHGDMQRLLRNKPFFRQVRPRGCSVCLLSGWKDRKGPGHAH